MTPDIRPDLEPHDADGLLPVASWLEQSRPVPTAAFRGELRRSLSKGRSPQAATPRRLWLLVMSSSCLGATMLAIAALGVAGSGPFAV